MKKKIVFLYILFSIVFSGCFLQMPESVSIKTNATYNVRIGKFKESFGSLFDINQLSQDQNTSDLQMKVFDYNPNGSCENVQQFLTKIPIQEIPIDFGKYMEKTDILQSISKISAKQEIEIPKIDLSTTQSFPFDGFKDLINGLVSFGGIAVNGAVNFLNKNSFDTVTYDYGTIIITNPKKDLTGSVKLIKDDVVLSEGNFVSGEANLSFLNTTFYSEGMIIEFSEPNANKDYVATFTEDSNFANVSGFTVDNYSIPIKTFVNFNLKNLGIEECVIEEGTLETSAEIPYSWNNISLSYDLNFSNLFEKSFNPNSEAKVMDMKDLEISDKELFVSSNIILSANNATIDSFSLPFFIFKLTVQKYKKIGFNLDASNYGLNKTEPLSSGIRSYIKSVSIMNSGIEGVMTNNLPEGNDIIVAVTSDFIGLNDSETVSAGSIDKEFSLLSSSSPKLIEIKNIEGTVGVYDSIDYKIDILFPGATPENPHYIVLNNVTAAEKFEIGLSLKSVIDWTEMVMYSSGSRQNGVIDTQLSNNSLFSSMNSFLPEDQIELIRIKSIPIYLYFEKPELQILENTRFDNGQIVMNNAVLENGQYVKTKDSPEIVFMNKESPLEFCQMPTFIFDDDTVITDISAEKCSVKNDLVDLIYNSSENQNASMCISYDFELITGVASNEIRIYKEDLEKSSVYSIALYALICLPLEFEAIDDIQFDLLKIFGMEFTEDIFGRTEEPTQTEVNEWLDVIESISLKYVTEEVPICSTSPMSFDIQLFDVENSLELSSGEILLEKPAHLMTAWPIIPSVVLNIPASTFSFCRDLDLKADFYLQLKTNGVLKF